MPAFDPLPPLVTGQTYDLLFTINSSLLVLTWGPLYTRWKCQYHIVFIPKYRRKVLYGKVKADVREILRTLCRYRKVEIIEGAVCVDHVHMCLSIPPKMNVSQFVGYLKGKSALMIYDRHPELGNKFERDFWARGYYVSTIGNVDEETIRKYIREQEEESYKESRTLK